MPSFGYDDEGEGSCPHCGCDLMPTGWFVVHAADCPARHAERKAEYARVGRDYGLTREEADREVSDEEFAAALRGDFTWHTRQRRKER